MDEHAAVWLQNDNVSRLLLYCHLQFQPSGSAPPPRHPQLFLPASIRDPAPRTINASSTSMRSITSCLCLSSQGHPEGGRDVSRPPEEDPQQRPDDAGTDEPDPVGGGLTLPNRAQREIKKKEGRKLGCRALSVEDGVDFFFSFGCCCCCQSPSGLQTR